MRATNGLASRFAVLSLYLACAGAALWLSIYRPFHNWDVVGYVASAKSFDGSDAAALQAFTYAELRGVLPPDLYEDIARAKNIGTGRGAAYRHAVSSDAAAFAEQLPYYQIRPLYTGLIYLLYRTGVDIEFATHAISGIGVAAGLLLLYLLAGARLSPPFASLLPPFAIALGLFDLARFSTPDGLAFAAVMLLARWLAMARINALLLAIPCVLGIRTDLILFTSPLLLALFVHQPENRRKIALSAAASVAIYFAIVGYYGNPGWSTFFYCTMVQRCTHPLSNPPALTPHDYFDALASGLRALASDADFAIYLLLVLASLYLIRKRGGTDRRHRATPLILLATSATYVVCRFFALPAEWSRAFPSAYVLSAFALLWLLHDRFVRDGDSVGARHG
jgi:hypothetical protein